MHQMASEMTPATTARNPHTASRGLATGARPRTTMSRRLSKRKSKLENAIAHLD